MRYGVHDYDGQAWKVYPSENDRDGDFTEEQAVRTAIAMEMEFIKIRQRNLRELRKRLKKVLAVGN
jgi:hypothetical protein